MYSKRVPVTYHSSLLTLSGPIPTWFRLFIPFGIYHRMIFPAWSAMTVGSVNCVRSSWSATVIVGESPMEAMVSLVGAFWGRWVNSSILILNRTTEKIMSLIYINTTIETHFGSGMLMPRYPQDSQPHKYIALVQVISLDMGGWGPTCAERAWACKIHR